MSQYTNQKYSKFAVDMGIAFEHDLYDGILGEQLNPADVMHVISSGIAVLFFATGVQAKEDREFYVHQMLKHAEMIIDGYEAELNKPKQ